MLQNAAAAVGPLLDKETFWSDPQNQASRAQHWPCFPGDLPLPTPAGPTPQAPNSQPALFLTHTCTHARTGFSVSLSFFCLLPSASLCPCLWASLGCHLKSPGGREEGDPVGSTAVGPLRGDPSALWSLQTPCQRAQAVGQPTEQWLTWLSGRRKGILQPHEH